MITRIVRMTFTPGKEALFLAIFNKHKAAIRHFPGCHSLRLMRDASEPNIFVTHSEWSGQAALEAYRHSEVFAKVWPQVKPLFSSRTVAFSLTTEMEVA